MGFAVLNPCYALSSEVARLARSNLIRTKLEADQSCRSAACHFGDMQPNRADEFGPCFVAIGASGAEGLRDLGDLLGALPANLAAVVLVVLHRPSDRISYLREVLARRSMLPVMIPDEDEEFEVGVCYVGEPAAHLSLAARSRVHLIEGPQDQYRNRTVDLLFTSVAAHGRRRAIGVVLRGELNDGSRGLEAIHFAGGVTMVLGTHGAATRGMPLNATEYDGPVDFIGSISDIAAEIVRRIAIRAVKAA
ncbi:MULTISPECIES: chemotaxis protein CheB [unclassified Bradyrhizobium]|uniref:chemotaxis protein CheB n=2 Tax=Bradyrhizobium TaxID=374 RepID=UPI0033943F92